MSVPTTATPRPRRTRLAVEPLEARDVPALFAQLDRGVLGIWGTDDGEDIIVRQVRGRLSVDGADIEVNGVARTSVAVTAVKRIDVVCGDGDDGVYLNSQTVAGQQAITRPARVWGQGGDDWVEGGQGADIIDVGTGEDVAYGHGGNDTLWGEGTKSWLYGESGNDKVEAEAGQMVLDGGSGNDRLTAHGDGTGWLDGGAGNDILTGGDGDDQLNGGPGSDRMLGGGGADNLDGGTGTDIMWGAWEPKVETLDDGIDTFRDVFNPAAPVYKGATVSDIRQMGSPLCVTLASMSAAIWSGFNFRDSIDYAGDNEYGVALFNPDTGEWEGHSVFFDGTWTDLDANVPRTASGAIQQEFWPVLIARAALQQRGVDLDNTDPAYIDANYPTDATDAITRLTSWDTADVDVAGSNPAALRAAINAGHAAVAATYDADPADMTPGVVPNHAYAVLDVLKTAAGWYVYLQNPWGRDYDATYQPNPDGKDDGLIVLRWDEFVADFSGYARTV